MSDQEKRRRRIRAQIAINDRWGGEPDRTAATDPARRAQLGRFAESVREEFPDLDDETVEKLAANRRTAFYKRIALLSAEARQARKAAGSTGGEAA